ncbi:6-carboxytetrahydropterin synthase [Streptomyces sp. NPDC051776]|uniref:6-pyruvoyl trahydropterin synthase family protein n=1 Tax=Streptomyces sp. NPDC051776 TaxID=3155414 RepID=UPI00342B7EB4
MDRFALVTVLEFSYGHRLLHYSGKCRHLHGHNGRLEVVIEADRLDDIGMALDFGQIKAGVGTWVGENLDHRMLLCDEDPLVPILRAADEPLYLMDANPTAENIAKLIWSWALGAGYPISEVRLWETSTALASYRGSE